MGRLRGLSSFSANFDILMAAPIDSRSVVDTVADLTNPEIWKANDGNTYLYKGLTVTVLEDASLYILTDVKNLVWEKVKGTSSGTGGSLTIHTTHTLQVDKWEKTEDGLYSYTILNNSIKEKSLVQATGVKESNDLIVKARFKSYTTVKEGSFTIYAERIPSEDIIIEIYIGEVE
jgi:hypothetical protein